MNKYKNGKRRRCVKGEKKEKRRFSNIPIINSSKRIREKPFGCK
jgi:hypothetical protein